MAKTKPKFKFIYVQDWGTYPSETLVVVGKTHEEVLRFAKKKKFKKDMLEWIENDMKSEFSMREDGGFLAHKDRASILFLSDFKCDWISYETLIHEIHHAIFYILGQGRGMESECEAQAYQMEWLFIQIRRRLDRAWLKWEKNKNPRP